MFDALFLNVLALNPETVLPVVRTCWAQRPSSVLHMSNTTFGP